jgi:hypothetical protein
MVLIFFLASFFDNFCYLNKSEGSADKSYDLLFILKGIGKVFDLYKSFSISADISLSIEMSCLGSNAEALSL